MNTKDITPIVEDNRCFYPIGRNKKGTPRYHLNWVDLLRGWEMYDATSEKDYALASRRAKHCGFRASQSAEHWDFFVVVSDDLCEVCRSIEQAIGEIRE